jgi:hypothetical protein
MNSDSTERDDVTLVQPLDEQACCDFCSATRVSHSYPAGPVVVHGGGQRQVSEGAWLACAGCHDLIEAGDLAALSELATTTYFATHHEGEPTPEQVEAVRAHMATLHLEFTSARRGPALAI